MSWVTFDADAALAQMSPDERAGYTAAHGADKLAGICSATVAELRGYLAGRTVMGAAGTIPESLARVAGTVARYHFLNSLPVKSLLTEQRIREYERAMEYLRDIAAGNLPAPVDGGGSGMSVVTAGDRLHTRDTLDGL